MTSTKKSSHLPSRPWSSQSLGSRFQHEIFYTLIRIGGRRAAYLLLYPVATWYALFYRSVHQRSMPYLLHRFPEATRWQYLRYIHSLCLNFGKTLVDRAVVGILGAQEFYVDFPQRQLLLDIIAEKRGLILINAHVGCWQVAMSTLSNIPASVYMLMDQDPGNIDRHYYEHRGIPTPYHRIDPNLGVGASLQLMQALKEGHVINLMGDRILGSTKHSICLPFLGESAYFPVTPYKLAAATGSPCAILFSCKTGPRSYQLTIPEVLRIPQDTPVGDSSLLPYAQRFIYHLEQYCQQYPFQFYNFFNLWAPP